MTDRYRQVQCEPAENLCGALKRFWCTYSSSASRIIDLSLHLVMQIYANATINSFVIVLKIYEIKKCIQCELKMSSILCVTEISHQGHNFLVLFFI